MKAWLVSAAGDHPAGLSSPGRTNGHPPAAARAQQMPDTLQLLSNRRKNARSALPRTQPLHSFSVLKIKARRSSFHNERL